MFDSNANTGAEAPAGMVLDHPAMTVAEWEAEERLVFALMDAGPDAVPSG